jgi:hypothetical protein
MTLSLLGWNLALALVLNDYVKLLLLRKLNLGRQAPGTTSESTAM